jgi:hypothetical protein
VDSAGRATHQEPAAEPVHLAIVLGQNLNDSAVVGLTKPDDAGKFKALIQKLDESENSGQPARAISGTEWSRRASPSLASAAPSSRLRGLTSAREVPVRPELELWDTVADAPSSFTQAGFR